MVLAFKEPAGTVCHSFEAFSRGCILLELEMISFLPIIFKLFFRVAGFAQLLRVFLFPFLKSWNKEQWHFADHQEILFDQCSEQLRTLFQFIAVVSC